jgi:hypothetical protein
MRITDFLIAAHEGDLDVDRMAALQVLVAGDPMLQREARVVKAARIPADRVVYAQKAGLRKGAGRVVPLWSNGRPMVRFAAAASLLLLLGMAWWLLREGPAAGGEVARKEAPVAPRPSEAPLDPERPAEREQASGVNGPSAEGPVRTAPSVEEHRRNVPAPVNAPALELPREEEPALAQRPVAPAHDPKPLPVPVAPVGQEAPVLLASTAPATAHTVRELLASGMRERVLDQPGDDRPLDRTDAIALADKGLKGITGGRGGVEVARTEKRDRFKVRLGEGLAFSGSIGR